MKNFFFFLLLILIFGLALRTLSYKTVPRQGATFDEFAWTWLGMNLIQKHVPISWSSQPQYKNKAHLIYQGAAFWIVRPYLEHPPLFGLVSGEFALANGVKDMYGVTLDKIRPLGIILGGFSILMVFLLSKELYGDEVSLLSTILYASVPTIVIGSRLVQNENFLIPIWLFSTYCLAAYVKRGKRVYRNLALISSAILPLAKVPWLVASFSNILILSCRKKWKDAATVSVLTLIFFLLFILYGFYFDKELFVNLWRLQIARYDISFSNLFSIFTSPLLVDRFYLDGWIFFGWFSIIYLMKDFKKNYFILLPFISYLILFIFAIPNEPMHGWYRYPFYPFLIISLAVFIKEEVIGKVGLPSVMFLLFVGLSLMYNTWEQEFGFSFVVYRIFIIFLCLPIISVIFPSKKTLKIGKIVNLVSLFLFIVLNVVSIINYKG